MIKKIMAAIFSSLLYLLGVLLFIKYIGQNLFGSSNNLFFLLSIILCAAAFFLLGFFNSKSLVFAILGIIIIFIIGIPLSYLVLTPITKAIFTSIIPNTNIGLSGSFSAIWFVLSPIILIEITTDKVIRNKKWKQLVSGVFISFLLMLGLEFLTSNSGLNSTLSIIKLVVYAPFTWALIVFFVNYNKGGSI